MACKKHRERPYIGYTTCSGCALVEKDQRIAELEALAVKNDNMIDGLVRKLAQNYKVIEEHTLMLFDLAREISAINGNQDVAPVLYSIIQGAKVRVAESKAKEAE